MTIQFSVCQKGQTTLCPVLLPWMSSNIKYNNKKNKKKTKPTTAT